MYYLHCMLWRVLNIFIWKEAVPQESHVLSTQLCCIIQNISHHFSLKHLGSDQFSFNYMLYLHFSKFRGTSVFKGIPQPIDEQ